MTTLQSLTQRIIAFRDERDWKQFHNPKDLAISLSLEAGEVMEHFQWKTVDEVKEYARTHKDDIGEELVDVLYWVLLLSHDLQIDLGTAFEKKMNKNKNKYPVSKSKGKATKYTKLQ